MAADTRSLAVLTAADDAPGMNAAIRSVVRMALHLGWTVWGVRRGLDGLLRGDLVALDARSVSHMIEVGGTFLGTCACRALREPDAIPRALASLRERGIEALVVIGGREAMAAAHALDAAGLPTVGVPASIENDLWGTDACIGADTALNTAIETLDRIQDTALSQGQAFVVEVSGMRSGYLTLMAGIAGGAEVTCIPEAPFTLEGVTREVADAYARGKGHCLLVVAEGAVPGAHAIHAHLAERTHETGFQVYLTVLGRVQRGGPPTAKDRFLATRLGAAATRALADGQRDLMVGVRGEAIAPAPLAEVLAHHRPLDGHYLELATILAR